MPRYVVERTILKMSPEEWQALGKKVVKVADSMPGVKQIKSSISESEGKSYCEFEVPNPEALRKHAEQAGLPVDKISQVEMEVEPGMFRQRESIS